MGIIQKLVFHLIDVRTLLGILQQPPKFRRLVLWSLSIDVKHEIDLMLLCEYLVISRWAMMSVCMCTWLIHVACTCSPLHPNHCTCLLPHAAAHTYCHGLSCLRLGHQVAVHLCGCPGTPFRASMNDFGAGPTSSFDKKVQRSYMSATFGSVCCGCRTDLVPASLHEGN